MAAVTSLSLETERANGQCKIVNDDQHVFQRYLLLLHPITYGIAAQVHVCRRFQQDEFAASYRCFGYESVTFVLKRSIGCLCKGIQYCKTDVVAGTFVLMSDVSQSYNQIFHQSGLILKLITSLLLRQLLQKHV